MTLEQAGKAVGSSGSRVQRIEAGEIKPRPGDVLELLQVYSVPLESDLSRSLQVMARASLEPGWWQRLGSIPTRYGTLIAYEEEATDIRNFEPMLVPGLLQTEGYARAVCSVGVETDEPLIERRVQARMQRQAILTRKERRPRVHAIVSEAALLVEVGSLEVMKEQLDHLVTVASRPNIKIQVLRFGAGAHMADQGSFFVLGLNDDPPLGYIDTLAGALFLEGHEDLQRVERVWSHLESLAMSPAESVKYVRERSHAVAEVIKVQ